MPIIGGKFVMPHRAAAARAALAAGTPAPAKRGRPNAIQIAEKQAAAEAELAAVIAREAEEENAARASDVAALAKKNATNASS